MVFCQKEVKFLTLVKNVIMSNVTQKYKSTSPFSSMFNVLKRMLFGNDDLLSDGEILEKYSKNVNNLENSKIAKELQNSLDVINKEVTAKQKAEKVELDKYKLSNIPKTSTNNSRSPNSKTVPSKNKSHDDEQQL